MHYILSIQDLENWKLSAVGGKGHALAEMLRIGVNVPEAFCVTADAYKVFTDQPAAKDAIESAIEQLRTRVNTAQVEDIATALSRTLSDVPLPMPIADEIKAAYTQLAPSREADELPVAVRSSATAEDLPNASFAGQHDSFLFMRGSGAVLEAVHKCWLSLWSARAIMYREQQGFDHEKVFMAVIIQKMIHSDVSGVLFTINPLTRDTSQMMVNAVWGPGEVLVSGEVTPDEWVMSKETGKILHKKIADKKMMAVEGNGMITLIEVPGSKRHQSTVSPEQLQQLRETGIRLEIHFGQPQDIEWSFENNQLYILQSRPITSLNRSPDSGSSPRQFRVTKGYWTRAGLGEWLQLPLSPLFSTLVLPALNFETDSLVYERLGIRRASPTWRILNGYYYIRADIVPTLSLLSTPIRFLQGILRTPQYWSGQIVPTHVRRIEQLREFTPHEATASEILAHFGRVRAVNAHYWAWNILSGAFAKITESVFSRLYKMAMGKTSVAYTSLLSGFPNKSVEADEALWNLSEAARAQEDVRSIILQNSATEALKLLSISPHTHDWYDLFCQWLNRYGHRVFDLDILYETMQDNPAIALQVIRTYLENPASSPVSRLHQQIELRRIAEGEFQRQLAKKPLVRKTLQACLTLAQQYAAIRESRPFYLHLGWPLMRQDVLELGRRLVVHSILPSANDAFFLTADELQQWAARTDGNYKPDGTQDESPRVNERKQEWEQQKSLTPPDNINPPFFVGLITRRSLPQPREGDEPSRIFTGSPGSPGRARGSACIVKSQDDFGKFKRGQILIAPYTTPVWTPLLSLAAGIVTETGGALSHAAIIAREYGIPAVVGVANILAHIADGNDVEVDGNAGRINVTKAQQQKEDQ